MAERQYGDIVDFQTLPNGDILVVRDETLAANDVLEFAVSFDIAIIGSACFGHSTGVLEDNVLDFANHGTGTATPSGSGDSEILTLLEGEYWEFNPVNFGSGECTFSFQRYQSPEGTPTVEYKTAATEAGLSSESWATYSVPFTSLGWVQARIEYP